MKTYIAVVVRSHQMALGYILDAYPEERAPYLAELKPSEVIGEYNTSAEAVDALALAMVPAGRMN